MPDLADLIQRRRDAGESYRDIARRSGGALDHQTVERLHKRGVNQFPRHTDTITGLARALDENVDQVVLSMAAQLGIPVGRHDTAAGILPAGAERLTFEQQRALRALIRAILDAQPANEQDSPPPVRALRAAAHRPDRTAAINPGE